MRRNEAVKPCFPNDLTHACSNRRYETAKASNDILLTILADDRKRCRQRVCFAAVRRRQQEYPRFLLLPDSAKLHDVGAASKRTEREAVADGLAPCRKVWLQPMFGIGARKAGPK